MVLCFISMLVDVSIMLVHLFNDAFKLPFRVNFLGGDL